MRIQFASFSPPRHPVLRVLLGILGLAVLAVFSVVGLFIAAAVAVIFVGRGLWLRWRYPQGTPRATGAASSGTHGVGNNRNDDVIDGEFTVIDHDDKPAS